ncbi:fasciclin domain-containing protein [Mucilaginibacter ginkgonis]|uniref:Fasciclin domain-containing protein n=1 Tax=Mucilaginibacter ginkgonis TaxID=2682091 RepID=A0A7T7FD74_9SPHI|nr:fasciclin domain-containing protein [Mucilaginibacter ginkgonis]QQL51139.1 fasciclin domain-containing protein [Mucilaginibacter ginkgonis]
MGTAYDIWENVSQTTQLTSLSKAIRASGLISTFRSNGPLTLFAPDNSAFQKLPKRMMDTLMKRKHVLDLSALLTGQAVPGNLSIKDLEKMIDDKAGQARLTTLGGNIIIVSKGDGDDLVLTDERGNKVKIIANDLTQRNGYIHVINGVLMPKPRVL